jgi:hypothetical protein
MILTQAQLTTLKTDILANTNTVTYQGSSVQIKNLLFANGDACDAAAAWYSLTAAGPWIVWRDLPMDTVRSLITYAAMTPADNPDGTQVWANRSLACQGKQFNLQNLTIGLTVANMKRTNYRAALQDCLTAIPAGAGGSSIAANWTGVRDAAKFSATNAEKVLSTGTGTNANPADLPIGIGDQAAGTLTGQNVQDAINLG